MRAFLLLIALLGFSAPLFAQSSGTPVPDADLFSRSLSGKFVNLVLYPDGTYERRASFYPNAGKKHWATTSGTWAKTTDDRFCLTRTSFWFHDPKSKNLFKPGTCVRLYRSSKGVIRIQINTRGDRPVKLVTANDGFHFPSIKALRASGAKQLPATSFLKSLAGRKFVVTQWLGLNNFVPARKPVFTLSDLSNTRATVTNRRGKSAPATLTTKGKSLCTEFKVQKLWAEGCGTVWQAPDARIYVVSDVSGFAYMGGKIQ